MLTIKDTPRSTVWLTFDGKVYKHYHGAFASERFNNEVKILRFLNKKNCPFVPTLLEVNSIELIIATSNCGTKVDYLDDTQCIEIFNDLISFGVRHTDATRNNITYNQNLGRFCIIDFEFAILLLDKDQEIE